MNTTDPSISWHIHGNHPTRVAKENERDEPAWIVGFQRGFEQLLVAVYGDGLDGSDAEVAAVEWLAKNHPQSLTDEEIERCVASTVKRATNAKQPFNADMEFDSVDEAVEYVREHRDPMFALLEIVRANIEKDECTFAAELVEAAGNRIFNQEAPSKGVGL